MASRFTPLSPWNAEAQGISCRLRGDRFLLWRKRKGCFALYPCVLRGKIDETNGLLHLRFTRPWYAALPLGLWLLLSLAAGLSVLCSETLLAPFFLLPVVLIAPSLFLFSKKEKTALLAALTALQSDASPER